MMCSWGRVNPICSGAIGPITVITCGADAKADGAIANAPAVARLCCINVLLVIISPLEVVYIVSLQGEPDTIYDKYQPGTERLRHQQADEKWLSFFVHLHAAHLHHNNFN